MWLKIINRTQVLNISHSTVFKFNTIINISSYLHIKKPNDC